MYEVCVIDNCMIHVAFDLKRSMFFFLNPFWCTGVLCLLVPLLVSGFYIFLFSRFRWWQVFNSAGNYLEALTALVLVVCYKLLVVWEWHDNARLTHFEYSRQKLCFHNKSVNISCKTEVNIFFLSIRYLPWLWVCDTWSYIDLRPKKK